MLTFCLLLQRRLGVKHAQRPHKLAKVNDVVTLQVELGKELQQNELSMDISRSHEVSVCTGDSLR